MINRRSFIERLGLGAGIGLLGPVASTLLSQAQGATQTRKRAVFFLHGNGFSPRAHFTPREFVRLTDKPLFPSVDEPVLHGPTDYTWPEALKPLEPFRRKVLLIDGLANRVPKSQHSAGYGALSCVPTANDSAAEYGGPPGGITIDQFIANGIGGTTPHKSVLYGIHRSSTGTQSNIFASGALRAEPHYLDPKLMFDRLFGSIVGTAGGTTPSNSGRRNTLLLQSMRQDIKRLQAALAGEERQKLDYYLAAVDEFDKRQKAVPAFSCTAPPAPTEVASKMAIEDRLTLMTDMAILALKCGLTNVVGVSAGCGNGHGAPWFTKLQPTPQLIEARKRSTYPKFQVETVVDPHGHENELYWASMSIIHNFQLSQLARMITALSEIKEGDRSIFDNSVMLYTSDNGDDHHGAKDRWPIIVIGNAGGALKTDGRFIRFKRAITPMANLFCSVATAVGVPTDSFGKGSPQHPPTGLLPEVMV